MAVLSYGAFFCFLVGLGIAAISLRLNARSAMNRAVAVLGAGYALYAFGYIWVFGSSDTAEIWLFFHVSWIGSFVIIPVAGLVADLLFAQVPTRRAALISLPFALFWVFLFTYVLTHDVIYVGFRPTVLGNAGVVSPNARWIGTMISVLFAQEVLSYIFMLRARSRTKSKRIKELLTVWAIVTLGLTITPAIEEWISRAYGLPSFDLFEGLLNIALLFFLIARYRYLRADRVTLEREIIRAMKEAVVLVEPDLQIRTANAVSTAIFLASEDRIISKRLDSLFDDPEAVTRAWERAVSSGTAVEIMDITVQAGDVELVLAPSFDRFGDLVGGVALVRKNDVLGSVLRQYGITATEREVILLLMQGYNRNEIAESRYVAPGTVKNHIHNIYEKTGVSNRVELLLLLSENK